MNKNKQLKKEFMEYCIEETEKGNDSYMYKTFLERINYIPEELIEQKTEIIKFLKQLKVEED